MAILCTGNQAMLMMTYQAVNFHVKEVESKILHGARTGVATAVQ